MNLPVIESNRGISRTPIEWADYAVGSPFRFRDKETGEVLGSACVKVSSGCANCYAEQIGQRFKYGRPYTKAEMARMECVLDHGVIDHMLTFKPKPSKGEATFKNGRSRPAVFFGDTTDIFGKWVSFEQLDVYFACMALRPDIDWLLLTKRPERMAEYLTQREISRAWSPSPRGGGGSDSSAKWKTPCDNVYSIAREWKGRDAAPELIWPLPNVWLGASVENRAALGRIEHLAKCPASVLFVSFEPLLEDLGDITPYLRMLIDAMGGDPRRVWPIVGGESGHDARPYNVVWGQSIIEQGQAAGAPVFHKQVGRFPGIDDIPAMGDISHACCMDANGESCAVTRRGGEMFVLRPHPKSSSWERTDCVPDGWVQCRRMRDRKGGDPSEWPEKLRVREMPALRD